MISICLDEMENEALYLLEQVNFPGDPSKWGLSTVKRSTDFSAIDIDGEIERAVVRWTPAGQLPATPDILFEITLRAAERDGITLDENQKKDLRAAVEAALQQNSQAEDVLGSLRKRRFSLDAANGGA